MFLGIILVSVFAFYSVGQAAITTPAGSSETVANQGILPRSGPTAVLGISMTATAGETLTAVTVTFTSTNSNELFTPATDLAALALTDSSGVAIYKDTAGSIDGEFDSEDNFIIPSVLPNWAGNSVTISFAAQSVPSDNTTAGNVGPDFFVVIRTSDNISGEYYGGTGGDKRDKFTVSFPTASIQFDGAGRTPTGTTITDTITAEAEAWDLYPVIGYGYSHTEDPFCFPDSQIRPRWDKGPASTETWRYFNWPPMDECLPLEKNTCVLGIACAGGTNNNPERIKSLDITFRDVNDDGSFDPRTMLDNFSWAKGQNYHGVILYKDSDGDGVWSSTDVLVDLFSFSWTTVDEDLDGHIDTYTLTYNVDTTDADSIIPTVASGKSAYFVVIRADSGYTDESGFTGDGEGIAFGTKLRAYLLNNKVIFEHAGNGVGNNTEPSTAGQVSTDIFAVCRLRDYIAISYSVSHIDATSPATPVLGINVCDTADTRVLQFNDEYIQSVKVYFSNIGAFDPADLRPLSSGANSGVSLWKDSGSAGYIGTFNESTVSDACIEIQTPTWTWDAVKGEYYVILEPKNLQDIPPDDTWDGGYRGDNYFVCVRTSETISYNDQFRAKIYADGITFLHNTNNSPNLLITSDIISTNVPTFLTNLTTGDQIIAKESEPVPIFGINLIDSTGTRTFSHLIVEFYDQGGFNPATDLAAMSADNISSGLALYKDANGNGQFDAGTDTLVTLSSAPYYAGVTGHPIQIEMDFLANQPIPLTDTGTDLGPDYFVVIRTSSYINDGDKFSVGIVSWAEPEGKGAILFDDGSYYSYERLESNTLTASSTALTASISGYLKDGSARPITGATVTLSGDASSVYTTESTGYYAFSSIPYGSYTVTPSLSGWTFSPLKKDFAPLNSDQTQDFTGTPSVTYSIAGNVKDYWGTNMSGVSITYQGNISFSTPTDASGNYTLLSVPSGAGTVTPSKSDWAFDPASRSYTLIADETNQDFTGLVVISITSGPTGSPALVNPGGSVQCSVTASNILDKPMTYNWQAEAGTFNDSTAQNPVWTAPTTYNPLYCIGGFCYYEISVTVSCDGGMSATSSYVQEGVAPPAPTEPAPEEGGSYTCFIATASYGTPMAKEVRSLCKFRDQILLKDPLGREFVKFYYATSPAIADFIRNRPGLKAMVREALKPLVWLSKITTKED